MINQNLTEKIERRHTHYDKTITGIIVKIK